jgi:hypothetical protein
MYTYIHTYTYTYTFWRSKYHACSPKCIHTYIHIPFIWASTTPAALNVWIHTHTHIHTHTFCRSKYHACSLKAARVLFSSRFWAAYKLTSASNLATLCLANIVRTLDWIRHAKPYICRLNIVRMCTGFARVCAKIRRAWWHLCMYAFTYTVMYVCSDLYVYICLYMCLRTGMRFTCIIKPV